MRSTVQSQVNSSVTSFLGLKFDNLNLAAAARAVIDLVDDPGFSYIVTPNVDHIVELHGAAVDSDALWAAYESATLRLCDSRILSLLGRASGIALSVVPGSDLLARLTRSELPPGMKVMLVGGNEAQREWLAECWAKATVTLHQPPFGLRASEQARSEVVEAVCNHGPGLILLTVGAPQSELIAAAIHSKSQSRGVALCVGASLEFLTGEKRRAPLLLQRLHLEWAHRLVNEPQRLWRRYLLRGPRILTIWWRWK